MDDLDSLRDYLSVARSVPTLRQQALNKLRSALIEGRLVPGSRLVERKLCDLLGVSRPIVRESLRQLEAEGWIVNPPYKGPMVAVIGEDEVRQIFEMRVALEGYAARLCAIRATPEQVDRLERVVEQMSNAQKEHNLDNQIRAIELFYEILLEGAGNELISNYLASQRSRLARLRAMSLSRENRAEVSVEEKRRIVEAIRSRNSEMAQRLGEEHVQKSAASALASIHKSALPAKTTLPPLDQKRTRADKKSAVEKKKPRSAKKRKMAASAARR